MTIGEMLQSATEFLDHHRIPSARFTAEVLLAHCLGRERTFLYTHPEQEIDKALVGAFISMAERRATREPLQYITGHQEFYGRNFSVNPDVLIPRPETELIVDAVLELNRWPRPRILDVGTGSGCIAATLALELPDGDVFASDISPKAVEIASGNAKANHATVHLACADLLDGWRGPFEFIVSNPPYISVWEREGLQPEVRDFEPHVALFGELDPESLYRTLLADAARLLVAGGYLILEMGYSMEEAVRKQFGRDWTAINTRSDLQGFPRVITAQRTEAQERAATDARLHRKDP